MAFQPGVDQVDDVARECGQVGDGLVLDLAAVAVGAAQVGRGVVLAAALLVDVPGLIDSDYMNFPAGSRHSQVIAVFLVDPDSDTPNFLTTFRGRISLKRQFRTQYLQRARQLRVRGGRSQRELNASCWCGQYVFGPQQQCSRLLFELDLIAQRDPVGAHRRDLRLEAGTAAINSTAMHPHQAEAAALVEAQRVNVVIGGNDPQAGAPLPPGQLPGRLDQGGPRPVPLLVRVQGEDLALPPVLSRHVREHAQQRPPAVSATRAG